MGPEAQPTQTWVGEWTGDAIDAGAGVMLPLLPVPIEAAPPADMTPAVVVAPDV